MTDTLVDLDAIRAQRAFKWNRVMVHQVLNKGWFMLNVVKPSAWCLTEADLQYAHLALQCLDQAFDRELANDVGVAIWYGKGCEGHDVDVLTIEPNPLEILADYMNGEKFPHPPSGWLDRFKNA